MTGRSKAIACGDRAGFLVNTTRLPGPARNLIAQAGVVLYRNLLYLASVLLLIF